MWLVSGLVYFFFINACSGADHLTFEAGVRVISEKNILETDFEGKQNQEIPGIQWLCMSGKKNPYQNQIAHNPSPSEVKWSAPVPKTWICLAIWLVNLKCPLVFWLDGYCSPPCVFSRAWQLSVRFEYFLGPPLKVDHFFRKISIWTVAFHLCFNRHF